MRAHDLIKCMIETQLFVVSDMIARINSLIILFEDQNLEFWSMFQDRSRKGIVTLDLVYRYVDGESSIFEKKRTPGCYSRFTS